MKGRRNDPVIQQNLPGYPSARERCVCLLPRDDFQPEVLIIDPHKRHIRPKLKNKNNRQGRYWDKEDEDEREGSSEWAAGRKEALVSCWKNSRPCWRMVAVSGVRWQDFRGKRCQTIPACFSVSCFPINYQNPSFCHIGGRHVRADGEAGGLFVSIF